jgi:hypothetical protein
MPFEGTGRAGKSAVGLTPSIDAMNEISFRCASKAIPGDAPVARRNRGVDVVSDG